MPSFESTRNGYINMWRSMELRPDRKAAIESAARKILTNKSRYQSVEMKTGVPWFFIAVLHMRESNNNFSGVLHNGERIIGTGRKTSLVPAGRGPFISWEEAAIDAIELKGLQHIKSWPIERIGYEGERFNGFGYMSKGVNSPYMWAGSNHYSAGKYIADGVYSSTHVDRQLGIMPVLYMIAAMDPTVKARIVTGVVPTVTVKPTPGKVIATGGTVAAGGAAAAAAWYSGIDWSAVIAIVVATAGISAMVWHFWWRKRGE